MFRLIRDTDVEFEEEAEDLVRSYETALKRRRRGVAIHLTLSADMPEDLAELVADELGASADEIFVQPGILGVADLRQLIVDDRPDLLFPPYTPRFPERIRDFGGDCFAAIRAKDIIVHHPFESFDVVVQFLRQAARRPERDRGEADAVSHQPRQPDRQGADRGGGSRQIRHRDGGTARALRRGGEHPPRARAGSGRRAGGVRLRRAEDARQAVAGGAARGRRRVRTYAHFGTGNYHPITARIYTDRQLLHLRSGADAATPRGCSTT